MCTETKEGVDHTWLPTLTEEFNKNFQSMFYMLNGKPDSKSRVFNKDICVDLDSIDDLNERVVSKLKTHYSIDESINLININITFDDRRTLNFSGWDKYKESKIRNPSAVRKITIIWDCLLKLPNYDLPQRHKLTVKITDGMRPQELLNLVFSGKIEEVEEVDIDSPVVVSVDFIDTQIGDELIGIVDEWIKTVLLPETKKNAIISALSKHKRKVAYFLNWLTTIIAIGSVFFVLGSNILIYKNKMIGELPTELVVDWISIVFFGFIFCFFIYRISYYISNNIFRILDNHGDIHIFKITKGDENEIDEIRANDEKSWGRIVKNILVTVVINLLSSGIATIIVVIFS